MTWTVYNAITRAKLGRNYPTVRDAESAAAKLRRHGLCVLLVEVIPPPTAPPDLDPPFDGLIDDRPQLTYDPPPSDQDE